MKKLYNKHKGSERVGCEDGQLMLDLTSCWKINKQLANVIDYLPLSGTREDYANQLRAAGVEFPDSYVDALVSKKILFEKKSLLRRAFLFLKQPRIRLVRGRWLAAIYNKRVYSTIFSPTAITLTIVGLVVALFFFYSYGTQDAAKNVGYSAQWIVTLCVLLGIAFHEMGHSLACAHYGIGARPIGLTWYLLWPIAFTNVSGVDVLDRSKRIVVNIAGIYFQSWVIIVFVMANCMLDFTVLYSAIKILVYLILYNLNPFIGSDFYWCYHDIVNCGDKKGKLKYSEYIFQAGYVIFTVWLVYRVGKNIISSIANVYANWQGFESLTLASLIPLLILTYIQVLIVVGVGGRVKRLLLRLVGKKDNINDGIAVL